MRDLSIRGGFLYTVSKYGDMPTFDQMCEALRTLRASGYESAELEGRNPQHVQMLVENKEKFRDLCQELGMQVVNYVMMVPTTSSLNRAEREEAVGLVKQVAELAEYHGCRTIEIDTFPAPLQYSGDPAEPEQLKTIVPSGYDWKEQWEAMIEVVRAYAQVAASAHCNLAVHPRIGEIVSNTDGMLRLIDAIPEDNLGVVFDTAQLHAQKEILSLSVTKIHERIWTLHVADNDGNAHLHRRLGCGTVDWDGLFDTLVKYRFAGDIAVDIANNGSLDDDYRESRRFLDDLLQKLEF